MNSQKIRWKDITLEFLKECQDLDENELCLAPGFRLHDSIASLKIGDSRMDSGMHLLDMKTPVVYGHDLPGMRFSAGDSILLIDYFVQNLYAWLFGGYPLAQTLQSCVCLRYPELITNPTVAVICFSELYIVSVIRKLILTTDCFQQEEFSHCLHGWKLHEGRFSNSGLLDALASCSKLITGHDQVERALKPRLDFLHDFVSLCGSIENVLRYTEFASVPISATHLLYVELCERLGNLADAFDVCFREQDYNRCDPSLLYHQHFSLLRLANQPPRTVNILPITQCITQFKSQILSCSGFIANLKRIDSFRDLSAKYLSIASSVLWQCENSDNVPLLGRSLMHALIFPPMMGNWRSVFDKPPLFESDLLKVKHQLNLVSALYSSLSGESAMPTSDYIGILLCQLQHYKLYILHAACVNKAKQQRLLKSIARQLNSLTGHFALKSSSLTAAQCTALEMAFYLKHRLGVFSIELGLELELFREDEIPAAWLVIALVYRRFFKCAAIPNEPDNASGESTDEFQRDCWQSWVRAETALLERKVYYSIDMDLELYFIKRFRPLTEFDKSLYQSFKSMIQH